MKADLATISNAVEDDLVYSKMTENGATGSVYIGLTNVDGNFIWQDGSTLGSYSNWASWENGQGKLHQEPNDGNGACVEKMIWNDLQGKWGDRDRDHECNVTRRYACSIAAHESCDTKKIFSNAMQKRLCVQTNDSSTTKGQASHLPGIDIFLNPARNLEKEKIIKTKKDFAKNYFKESDMQTLYPELFRIL